MQEIRRVHGRGEGGTNPRLVYVSSVLVRQFSGTWMSVIELKFGKMAHTRSI